jgi:hypothetical protein
LKNTILDLSICCLLLVALVFQSAYASDEFPVDVPPPWLKVGTYVEYRIDVESFSTGTAEATLRWECIGLDGTVATLNVSHTASASTPYEGHISPRSAIIHILTDTREVIYPNGTVIGKTFLWVPPFLGKDQKVVLEGKPPNQRIGIVTWDGGSCVTTCQGFQEASWVHTYNETGFVLPSSFDVNTGILVDGAIPHIVLEVLNAEELILGAHTIIGTNVDLGPQYLPTLILRTIWNNLPIILPIMFVVTAFLLIRRKRKRQKAHRTE